MRRRQVKVVGNCHASAVANFYRDFVGAPNYEDVTYVDDLGLDTEQLRQIVADADLVIVQERDFRHGLSREELGTSVEVQSFPLVLGGFLWPFANEAHVHNVVERPISDGPYPSQLGDSFLNRLILKGVSAEDALEQYLALDIARAASLDRMLEIYLERQRQRDAATGFEMASTIERDFRGNRLFLTGEHPNGGLFGHMAAQLFRKMHVPESIIATAISTLERSPFPPTELPLHPGVIAHFGLTYIDGEARYSYLDEGHFTFEEYVLRYMRYTNNPELRRAVYEVGRSDPTVLLPELDRGLALSPQSSRGLRHRALVYQQLDRRDEAIADIERAIAIEPANPDCHVELSLALRHSNRLTEAKAAAARAIAMSPTTALAHLAMSEAQIALGENHEAVESAQRARALCPGKGIISFCLGLALFRSGAIDEAEIIAQHLVKMEPWSADHRNLLVEILEELGRRDEAIALLEESFAIERFNDQSFSLLGNLRWRQGDLAGAEEAFRDGAALFGQRRPDLAACLGIVQREREAIGQCA